MKISTRFGCAKFSNLIKFNLPIKVMRPGYDLETLAWHTTEVHSIAETINRLFKFTRLSTELVSTLCQLSISMKIEDYFCDRFSFIVTPK